MTAHGSFLCLSGYSITQLKQILTEQGQVAVSPVDVSHLAGAIRVFDISCCKHPQHLSVLLHRIVFLVYWYNRKVESNKQASSHVSFCCITYPYYSGLSISVLATTTDLSYIWLHCFWPVNMSVLCLLFKICMHIHGNVSFSLLLSVLNGTF